MTVYDRDYMIDCGQVPCFVVSFFLLLLQSGGTLYNLVLTVPGLQEPLKIHQFTIQPENNTRYKIATLTALSYSAVSVALRGVMSDA